MEIKIEKLEKLLENRQLKELRTILCAMNEVDVAEFLSEQTHENALLLFRMLSKETASEVFPNLEMETQRAIIGEVSDQELASIVEELFVDDAVDLLEELPANVVKRVLQNARPETRALINRFLKYPEDSVGSVMTAEFTDLRGEMTVGEAIERLRSTGEDRVTIYICYVIDASRCLQGVVTVKDLLLSKDDKKVSEIMDPNVISIGTLADQEEAAQMLNRYGFLALPVVDEENRLVGIVTVDDAMEIMEREATEDFEVMSAMLPSEKPYLKTGVLELAKNRIVWLLVLMISSMLTGSILSKYEAAFAVMPVLVSFIPMLTDTGGNAGSQSSTLVIRGLAVGDLTGHDALSILWKELRVALLVGVVLSTANFVRLLIMYPGQTLLSFTVALAMLCTVLVAKTVGGLLPLAAKAIHADPAIMASPLITTIVDALSLVIYFRIAITLLPI